MLEIHPANNVFVLSEFTAWWMGVIECVCERWLKNDCGSYSDDLMTKFC